VSQVGGRDDHRRERTRLYGERMRAHISVRKSATGSVVRRASLQGRGQNARQTYD
jgi:hypothetical protein